MPAPVPDQIIPTGARFLHVCKPSKLKRDVRIKSTPGGKGRVTQPSKAPREGGCSTPSIVRVDLLVQKHALSGAGKL